MSQRPDIDIERLREVFRELEELDRAGRLTVEDWYRLFEEGKRAVPGAPELLAGFAEHMPDA